MPVLRDKKGHYLKGTTGNAGGRRPVSRDFQVRCRKFMEAEGWGYLEVMARDPKDTHRDFALKTLAAYGVGLPPQRLEHTGEDGEPILIKTVEVFIKSP